MADLGALNATHRPRSIPFFPNTWACITVHLRYHRCGETYGGHDSKCDALPGPALPLLSHSSSSLVFLSSRLLSY